MRFNVGIDIGGTFTDCVAVDSAGNATSVKVPSTPPHFEHGFHDALETVAAELDVPIAEFLQSVDHVLHGTTVATNVMVQRSGAKVGVITTKGHGDATLIMKGHGRVAGLPTSALTHPQRTDKPIPLVPRRLIKEVDERIDVAGDVVVELNREAVRAAGEELLAAGCEAIAVCFLWSFRNEAHEQAAKHELLSIVPAGFPVICSAEVVPRWGEYERFMACILSAYLAPETDRYLNRLQQSLTELREEILVIQCTGAVMPLSQVSASAAYLIGSGPIGGMNGSEVLVGRHGVTEALCTDMGGTSFDVGLIVEGRSLRTRKAVVDQFEYQVPAIDVRSIGSGGGSIISIDPISGSMRVGPRSAGAYPGPPCYRRGGTEPTVTDANLLIGFIDPDYFLGGKLQLDAELARAAMTPIAAALGMTVEEAAAGAIHIVENQMAELLQKMSLEQGHDPRKFTVLAYGGAASLHATAYARHLGATDVIVPGSNVASVWSAYGIGSSDPGMVLEAPLLLTEPMSPEQVLAPIEQLRRDAVQALADQGWDADRALFDVSVDIKFKGQLHVIEVPLYEAISQHEAIVIELESLFAEFESRYEQKYGEGTGFRDAGFAIDAVRLNSRVPIPTPEMHAAAHNGGGAAQKGTREVYWPHLRERRAVAVYDGMATAAAEGPAILEFPFTSIVLRDGDRLAMTSTGDARITIGPRTAHRS
jgi:N-methylhydantoinase A